jgi:hypothetical protein
MGLFGRAPAPAPPPAPAGALPNALTPDGFGGGAPEIPLTGAVWARRSHKTLASSGSASPFPTSPPGGACRSRAEMRARSRWVGGRRPRRAGEGGRMPRHQRREVAAPAGESGRKMRSRLHRRGRGDAAIDDVASHRIYHGACVGERKAPWRQPVEEQMGLWRVGRVASVVGWDGGAARQGRARRRCDASPAGRGGAGRVVGLVPGGSSVGEWIRRQRSGRGKGSKKGRGKKKRKKMKNK